MEKTNVIKDIVESISNFNYHFFTLLTDGNVYFAKKYYTIRPVESHRVPSQSKIISIKRTAVW